MVTFVSSSAFHQPAESWSGHQVAAAAFECLFESVLGEREPVRPCR